MKENRPSNYSAKAQEIGRKILRDFEKLDDHGKGYVEGAMAVMLARKEASK